MAKKFEDWLDEFVEKGANPENVIDWPDGGGGSTEEGTLFAYKNQNGYRTYHSGTLIKDADVGKVKQFLHDGPFPSVGVVGKTLVRDFYIDYEGTRLQEVMTGGYTSDANGVLGTFVDYGNDYFFGVNGQVDGNSTYLYYSSDGLHWDYYELFSEASTPIQVKVVNSLFVVILQPSTTTPYVVFYGTDITNLKKVEAVGYEKILDICYMPDKQKYIALATGDQFEYTIVSIDTAFENVINDEAFEQNNVGTLAHKVEGIHSMAYAQTEDDDYPVIYIFSSSKESGSSALQKIDVSVVGSQLTTVSSPSCMAKQLLVYDNPETNRQSLITTSTINAYYLCYNSESSKFVNGSFRNFLAAYLPTQDKFVIFNGHKQHQTNRIFFATYENLVNGEYNAEQSESLHPYVGWGMASNGERCVIVCPTGLLIWNIEADTEVYTLQIVAEEGHLEEPPLVLQRSQNSDIHDFISEDKTFVPQPVILNKYNMTINTSTAFTVPGDGTKELTVYGSGNQVEIRFNDTSYYATVYDTSIQPDSRIEVNYMLSRVEDSVVSFFISKTAGEESGWLQNAQVYCYMNFSNEGQYLPLTDNNPMYGNGTEVSTSLQVGDSVDCSCFGLRFVYGAQELFVWFRNPNNKQEVVE